METKHYNLHSNAKILIEPSDIKGLKPVVSLRKPKEELAKQTEKAIEKTMETIHEMITKINTTIETITPTQKPKHIEVQFGIKFDADLDIIIARAGTEASFQVTMIWK
jgi:Trypsin-co-occurring domain 1